jgi:hypothetical protein
VGGREGGKEGGKEGGINTIFVHTDRDDGEKGNQRAAGEAGQALSLLFPPFGVGEE